MIRKNILAIALLGAFGVSHAADVENLRTLSYLNEPLRLQADVVGEGDIVLAAPTEYLRLNHPIPTYDLSIDLVEHGGQKQVVLTTTEEIESPALTLLLESRDQNNRRQLFELPILLDFKPEPVAVETADAEIEIDGVAIDPPATASKDIVVDTVTLEEVPVVAEETTVATPVKEPPAKTETAEAKAKVAEPKAKTESKAPVEQVATTRVTDPELVKRYSVEKGETLWSIANKVRPANVTPQKMIEIIKANNPSAFTAGGVLRADVTLLIPTETPKVQHKFVASTDANEKTDVRIGYIYELPEPPVQQVVEPVENTEDVTVKVVHPMTDNVEVKDEQLAEPVNVVETQVEEVATPVETVTPAEVEQPIEKAEPVVAQEPAKEVVKAVEPPKKPAVYVMPEPEPEPGIVELLFENIVYIGAGALVIILGLLAVVMRGRKKDDAPKPAKEKKVKATKEKAEKPKKESKPKKKGLLSLGKQKADTATTDDVTAVDVANEKSVVEAVANPQVAPVVAAAVVTTAAEVSAVTEPKAEDKDDTVIESLDFDLSFADQVQEPAKTEPVPTAAEASSENTVDVLDFDLSSLDLQTTEPEPELAPTEDVEPSIGGLDFDLSSLDLGSTTETTTEENTEEYEALDFDLSGFSAPEVEAQPTQDEEIFEVGETLDFDLGDFKVEENSDTVADSSTEQVASFGENNPIFAAQVGNADTLVEHEETVDSGEPIEYISFPDLLDNAEDALVKDDIEAKKPADFGSFLEDEEAGIANLMEASKQSEGETKLDLAFVADADDDAASIAFLDSLDVTDKITLDDPINSSVKDNVAKSAEMTKAPEVTLAEPVIEAVEAPEVTLAEPVIEAVEVPEVTLVEPVIETVEAPEVTLAEPVIEAVEVPEVTLAEPVIEAVEVPEVTLAEPVIEAVEVPEVTLAEPVIEAVEVPEVALAEPVIAAAETSVAEGDFESEQVKLELAVAYMDFDKSLAKPLLDEVIKDGSPKQVERAQALLAQID